MRLLQAALTLASIPILGCRTPSAVVENTAKTTTARPDSALLGKWVTTKPYSGDIIGMDFKESGNVEIFVNGKYYYSSPFGIQSVKARDEYVRGAQIHDGPTFAELYGDHMHVVTLYRKDSRSALLTYFLDPENQLLTNHVFALVRPGKENKQSKRIDSGDSSRAPFRFLSGHAPIFADKAAGDWGYTFKANWATTLKTAAAELRRLGFVGVLSEESALVLKGEAGSVFYYRTNNAEEVGLVPNVHSVWRSGKWVTTYKKGWVTVHVDLKGP